MVALDDGLDDSPACLPSAERAAVAAMVAISMVATTEPEGANRTASVFAPSSRAKLVGKLVLPPTPAVLGASRSTDLVLIKPPNELESVRSN